MHAYMYRRIAVPQNCCTAELQNCEQDTHTPEGVQSHDIYKRASKRACLPSPTLSPTDPVPRGLLTLCPGLHIYIYIYIYTYIVGPAAY